MIQHKILVEDYSEAWAFAYAELKAVYERSLAGFIIDIQHVGSTSVQGLAAKPIIDIDIIIEDKGSLPAVIEKLGLLGYEHQGDLGITDRSSFKRISDTTPEDGSGRTWQKHHLYVCPKDSISLNNHLVLRDVLRNNPEKARAYGALKRKLASENPYDMGLYVERKTPFILAILEEAGFDPAALHMISNENKMSKPAP